MDSAFLLLCDHSEALNGKLYSMGAGWNTLRFPQLPQEWGFGIGLGIDVPWDETNRRHQLQVHVEGPDGERLGEPFAVEFEAGRPPGAIAGQDQRMVLALGSRHTFESAGPHAVIATVNEEEIGRARFHVAIVPMPMISGVQLPG